MTVTPRTPGAVEVVFAGGDLDGAAALLGWGRGGNAAVGGVRMGFWGRWGGGVGVLRVEGWGGVVGGCADRREGGLGGTARGVWG